MSVKALNWAIRQPAKPHEKLVLMVLAHHHNEKRGGQCDPALTTIAAETGLSKNGARSALAGLEAAGAIKIFARTNRGRDISKQYVLACDDPNKDRIRGAPGEPQKGTRRGAPGEPLNAELGVRPVKGAPGEPMGASGEPNRERIGKEPSQKEEGKEVEAREYARGLRVVGGDRNPWADDGGAS